MQPRSYDLQEIIDNPEERGSIVSCLIALLHYMQMDMDFDLHDSEAYLQSEKMGRVLNPILLPDRFLAMVLLETKMQSTCSSSL